MLKNDNNSKNKNKLLIFKQLLKLKTAQKIRNFKSLKQL